MFEKTFNYIDKVKNFLKAYLSSTLLGLAIARSSPEDWDNILKKNLQEAKMRSDFVATLMRAAFAFLLFRFFSEASIEEGSTILGFMFGMNAFLCLALYLSIIFKIFDVIIAYWLRDSSYCKSCGCKIAVIVCSLIISTSIGYGIGVLVSDLASASSLLN